MADMNFNITDPDMRAMMGLPPLSGWTPRMMEAQGEGAVGSMGYYNWDTGQWSSTNPNAVSNPIYAIGQNQAQGEGATSSPYYANQATANQYLPYQGFLEQALSDSAYAGIQNDPNFNLSQYFNPATAGAQPQNLIPQANEGMQKLLAANPNLQMRPELGAWNPWSDYNDFNTRQNSRPGFNDGGGLLDFFADIPGDLLQVGQDLWQEPGFRQLALTAAGGALGGEMSGAGIDQAGTAAYGGLDGGAVAQGMGVGSTGAGVAGGTGLVAPTTATPSLPEMGGAQGLVQNSTSQIAGMGGGTGLTLPAGGASTTAGALSPGFFASEGLAPGGGSISGPGGPSVPSTGGAGAGVGGLGMVRDGLSLGGGLYNLYQANQTGNAIQDSLNQANQQAAQNQFPYGQYRGLVDQYMNDPMSLLRNNPGYLASVDYLRKAGQRQMAGKGFNNAGNKDFYLADVLGKNAQSWWRDQWQPIAQTAGVTKENDPARLASVQANAMNSIFQNQQQALGSVGKAAGDFLGSNTGKKAWDWAFG